MRHEHTGTDDCPACEQAAKDAEEKIVDDSLVPNDNRITSFLGCVMCIAEMREKEIDMSYREYARLEIGFTKQGLQAICVRHEVNVLHVDFEGHRHPANTSARKVLSETTH